MRFFTHSGGLFNGRSVRLGLKCLSFILPIFLLVATTSATYGQMTLSSTQVNVTCPSNTDGFSANGSIDLSVAGGTAPFNYLWNNGATTQDRVGLSAGVYTVTVTDATPSTQTHSVTITIPDDFDVEKTLSYFGQDTLSTQVTVFRVSCYGSTDGSYALTSSGGTPPYSFLWSNYATTSSISGLEGRPRALGGKGYAWAIHDDNDCWFTFPHIKFYSPNEINATINSQTNVTCNGGSNGAASITINNYNTLGINYYQVPTPLTNLSAGPHSLTATVQYWDTLSGARTCSKLVTATITEPAAMVITGLAHAETCVANGWIDITNVTGNTSPYTFLWSNGKTTQDNTGLIAGTYTVTVYDVNLCSQTASYTVTSETPSVSGITDHVNCYNGSDGSIDLTVTGGAIPYIYSWSNSTTEQDVTGLIANTYSVTVAFNDGCNVVRNFTVTQPTELTGLASVSNVVCNGQSNGSIDFSPTGGTTPYYFIWTDGYTTEDISGLSAKPYFVTLTDAQSCVKVYSYTVTEPDELLISGVVQQNVFCNGGNNGSLDISVSGGNGGYTYFWTGGLTTQDITGLTAGTYTIAIQDVKGCATGGSYIITQPDALTLSLTPSSVLCNGGSTGSVSSSVGGGFGSKSYLWSNGGTNSSISNLPIGTYSLNVTDGYGCTITNVTTVTQPSALSGSVSSTAVTCNGDGDGSLGLNVSGGTSTYTFAYSGPSSLSTPGLAAGPHSFSGLDGGTYNYTITDANGCYISGNKSVYEPEPLIIQSYTATDVTCNGLDNGSIDIYVTGGDPGSYDFTWSGGIAAFTEDVTGLAPSVYDVYITDANNCVTTGTYTIHEPAVLSAIESITPVTCFGFNDGTISLAVNGGTTPYNYTWNPAKPNSGNLTGLAGGVYNLTITDAKACTFIDSYTVNAPTLALAVSSSVIDVLCHGESNGSVELSPTGGTPGYTYQWSWGGSTTAKIENLPIGPYSFTVTDSYNCKFSNSATVAQPLLLKIVNPIVTPELCFGQHMGAINITVEGGFFPSGYDFAWTFAAPSNPFMFPSEIDVLDYDISGLYAGVYSVTVTDGNDCKVSGEYNVTQPSAALSVSLNTNTPVTCFGYNNGTIDVNVTGGTTNYTYQWSSIGGNTDYITGLPGGDYYVTVTDANGCIDDLGPITINAPVAVLSYVTPVINTSVSCFDGNDGTIDLNPQAGTPPYTYLWTPGGYTSQDLAGLSADTYSFTITDFYLCKVSGTVTVTEPTDIVLSSTKVNVTCKDGNNGSILVSATGGEAPSGYDFQWTLEGGGTLSASDVTAHQITGLEAGVYSVTVTGGPCQKSLSFTITEPDLLTITTINHNNLDCFGDNNGWATAVVTGGTTPYNYIWSNGVTNVNITGLVAGVYGLTVNDTKGCGPITSSVTLTQPLAALSIAESIVNVDCFGNSTGEIDITVSGGTGSYDYNWNVLPPNNIIADQTNLIAGTYSVTVTDDNDCVITETFTVTEPNLLVATIGVVNLDCNGDNTGELHVSVTGGTAPFTYDWSDLAPTLSPDRTGLAVGTYYLTVSDINGCETTNSAGALPVAWNYTTTDVYHVILIEDATFNNSQLLAGDYLGVFYYDENSDLKCGGYSIWPGSGNIAVVAWGDDEVTDPEKEGFELNNLATETFIWKVFRPFFGEFDGTAGYYPIDGIDVFDTDQFNGGDNGQSKLSQLYFTPTINQVAQGVATITQPDLLSFIPTLNNVSCFDGNDGSISIIASGGTTPYTYEWNDFGGVIGTGASITGLTAGTYWFDIYDNNGCFDAQTFTITQPLVALSASISKSDVNCFGASTGSVSITPTGGTAPYSFLWSNGATTQNIVNVPANSYSVSITDSEGCNITKSATVTQNTAILISGIINNSCYNNLVANGGIDVTVSGGNGTYTYLWSNLATTQDINGLSSGSYTVTVTDGLACSASQTLVIGQENAILATASIINLNCANDMSGEISLDVSGGAGSYSYIWHTFATTEDLTSLDDGVYYLTITDGNGCYQVFNYMVSEPNALVLSAGVTNASCNGYNGAIDLSVTGGVAPYSYVWQSLIGITLTNIGTSQDLSGLTNGLYNVTVTDANGCVNTGTWTVAAPGPYSVLVSITDVECHNGSNGEINLSWSGGFSPYTVHLYMVESVYVPVQSVTGISVNNLNLTGLVGGTYKAVVVDVNNCGTFVEDLIVDEPLPFNLTGAVSNFNGYGVSCNGLEDGYININNVTGGTAPYEVHWFGDPLYWDEMIIPALAPNFSIFGMVTDAHGCSIFDDFIIGNEPPVLSMSSSYVPIVCFGNTTTVTITATGGVPAYTGTGNIAGVSAGANSFTVTDLNGCSVTSSVSISQPALLVASSTEDSPIYCFGEQSEVSVSATGGTPPYVSGTGTFNLSAGFYTFTVTDNNGCKATTSRNLVQPPDISLSFTQVNVLCNGASTGSINLTVNGGTPPYSNYVWSSGQATEDIAGITAGIYTVTVYDNNYVSPNTCWATGSVTITEPPAFDVDVNYTSIPCFGNSSTVTVTATGGVAPYVGTGVFTELAGAKSYTITDNNGCSIVENFTITQPALLVAASTYTTIACNGDNSVVTVSAIGGTLPYSTGVGSYTVTAGAYSYTVTDANSCKSVTSVNISQPALLVASSSYTTIACNGDNSVVSVSAIGGTLPYVGDGSYTVAAGPYSYTVTDANGCSKVTSGNISQPALLEASSSYTTIACNGDNSVVTVSAVGGTLPYVGGGSYTVTAGPYSYTVTDANGCSKVTSGNISQPDLLVASSSYTTIACHGDNSVVTVSAVGGTTPYVGNGSYTVSAGAYSYTVTDANGCAKVTSGNITEPAALVFSATTPDPFICTGLTFDITLNYSGGTPAYTVTGVPTTNTNDLLAGTYNYTVTDANGCKLSQTVTVDNYDVPEYTTLTLDNANGTLAGGYDMCMEPGTQYLYLDIFNAVTNVPLQDGYYEFNVGTTPVGFFDYWNDKDVYAGCGGTWQPQMWQIISGADPIFYIKVDGGVSTIIDGLQKLLPPYLDAPLRISGDYPPGAYTFNGTVTSTDGCPSANIEVEMVMNQQPTASIDVNFNTVCNTNNAVAVTVDFVGGTGPYNFTWNDGTDHLVSGVADPYSFTITPNADVTISLVSIEDANGCTNMGLGSEIILVQECYTVDGKVLYNNAAHTPMTNVSVSIMTTPGLVVYGTTTTDGLGAYNFPFIPVGNYVLGVTTAKPHGGINATDAFNVSTYSPFLMLERLNFLAGDVTNGSGITSGDALKVLLRTTNPSVVFERGNWTFSKLGTQVNNFTMPQPHLADLSLAISVNTIQDIYAQVVGDFNQSYVPPVNNAKDQDVASVSVSSKGTIPAHAGELIEVPLYINRSVQLGAITLFMNFPNELVYIENVQIAGSNMNPVFRVEGNELRIAWYDNNTVAYNTNSEVIKLKVRMLSGFGNNDEVKFDLNSISLSEVADQAGNVLNDVTFNMGSIVYSGIGEVNDNQLSISAYPNPFSTTTTLNYYVPTSGNVKVEVFNSLGELVSTIINTEVVSGSYTVEFDAAELTAGIYTCKVSVNGRFNGVQTARLVITR